jgi:hypothetical protein
MKYLCLIYFDPATWAARPPAEAEAMMREYADYTRSIKASGHWVAGNRLESVAAATTVRIRAGKLSTTDGPYAETKEQLGGYYLIEATDLNEAIQVAARIPGARVGSIEVRPVAPNPT